MMTGLARSVVPVKLSVVGKMNFLKALDYRGLETALNPALSQIR